LEVPVYKFVKEALVRKFGEDDWYAELETVAKEIKTIQNRKTVLVFYFKILYFTVLKSVL
jgi:hypothetical protein